MTERFRDAASGNTVLITGGSSGIGYAMAGAFLQAGSKVVICAGAEPDCSFLQMNSRM